jgi:hypothetical protein
VIAALIIGNDKRKHRNAVNSICQFMFWSVNSSVESRSIATVLSVPPFHSQFFQLNENIYSVGFELNV